MDEKISLVHTLKREGVLASYKEFVEGVQRDFQAGELPFGQRACRIDQAGRGVSRAKMWTKAEECYREASKDPHYDYARYYMGFCGYAQNPDPSY